MTGAAETSHQCCAWCCWPTTARAPPILERLMGTRARRALPSFPTRRNSPARICWTFRLAEASSGFAVAAAKGSSGVFRRRLARLPLFRFFPELTRFPAGCAPSGNSISGGSGYSLARRLGSAHRAPCPHDRVRPLNNWGIENEKISASLCPRLRLSPGSALAADMAARPYTKAPPPGCTRSTGPAATSAAAAAMDCGTRKTPASLTVRRTRVHQIPKPPPAAGAISARCRAAATISSAEFCGRRIRRLRFRQPHGQANSTRGVPGVGDEKMSSAWSVGGRVGWLITPTF